MTWNYRIVRYLDGSLGLHEVFYDEEGRPKAVTADAISFVADPEEGPDGIVQSLRMALADAERHRVLDWAELPGQDGNPIAEAP